MSRKTSTGNYLTSDRVSRIELHECLDDSLFLLVASEEHIRARLTSHVTRCPTSERNRFIL